MKFRVNLSAEHGHNPCKITSEDGEEFTYVDSQGMRRLGGGASEFYIHGEYDGSTFYPGEVIPESEQHVATVEEPEVLDEPEEPVVEDAHQGDGSEEARDAEVAADVASGVGQEDTKGPPDTETQPSE